MNTIPTREVRRPDGSIREHGATVFIFELESNSDWNATTLKLTIHLAQMLASLRNRSGSPPIDTIVGFYFPWKSLQCVVEVQVKWSDNYLKFVETHSYVEMIDINARLVAIYLQNEGYWRDSSWTINTTRVFNYPVTSAYVVSEFGRQAIQVESGCSVVIVSSGYVYKKPMNSSESSRLSDLRGRTHLRIGFPFLNIRPVGGTTFFKFDEYLPPPSVPAIQEKGVWYTRSLVDLVLILHQFNIAHLDLRTDNICVSRDGLELVLIDLDRSRDANENAMMFVHRYGTSDIKVKIDWTNKHLDWAQIGLMLKKLFPGHQTNAFIKTPGSW